MLNILKMLKYLGERVDALARLGRGLVLDGELGHA